MIVHFHRDSVIETVRVILNQHHLIDVNLIMEGQNLMVADK